MATPEVLQRDLLTVERLPWWGTGTGKHSVLESEPHCMRKQGHNICPCIHLPFLSEKLN